jgi:hypothetical protein
MLNVKSVSKNSKFLKILDLKCKFEFYDLSFEILLGIIFAKSRSNKRHTRAGDDIL